MPGVFPCFFKNWAPAPGIFDTTGCTGHFSESTGPRVNLNLPEGLFSMAVVCNAQIMQKLVGVQQSTAVAHRFDS